MAKSTDPCCESTSGNVTLAPIERPEITLVAGWLADPENARWLDFGAGHQVLTATSLALMLQRDIHVLRAVRVADAEAPVGIVALSNVDRRFRTAQLWYVLGDKRYAGRGCTTVAVAQLLDVGFDDIVLDAINAWAVEPNRASIRVLERNHFRLVGRQRQCHYIDGRPFDRLLFDLLASEFKENRDARSGESSELIVEAVR